MTTRLARKRWRGIHKHHRRVLAMFLPWWWIVVTCRVFTYNVSHLTYHYLYLCKRCFKCEYLTKEILSKFWKFEISVSLLNAFLSSRDLRRSTLCKFRKFEISVSPLNDYVITRPALITNKSATITMRWEIIQRTVSPSHSFETVRRQSTNHPFGRK